MRALRITAQCIIAVMQASSALAAPHSFRDCPRCPEMVALPPMPQKPGQADRSEQWALGRTEVTFAQWQACVDAKACRGGQDDHLWGRGNRPVINVTWQDAQDYAAWLSDITGQTYVVPPEAVWDFAARAGTVTNFPWGDDVGANLANCRDCGSKWSGRSTAPVASFKPNPFGLYDMNGNVWEWTADCWDDACTARVMRGGAWYYFSPMSKSAARAKFDAKQWSYTLGFRVAKKLTAGD